MLNNRFYSNSEKEISNNKNIFASDSVSLLSFDGSSTISGTRSFHHFECDGSLSHLFARQYSSCERIKKVKISNF